MNSTKQPNGGQSESRDFCRGRTSISYSSVPIFLFFREPV